MIIRLLPTMLLATLWTAPLLAQTYTFTPQSSHDLVLTFQTQREGPSRVLVQGEVRNNSSHACERVVIKAEGLDENGRVVSRGRVYVPGTINPRTTSPFEIRLSSAGSERRYRVEIETFEFGTRRGSEGQ
ncbi:MAG TPA: FxLYD domain-containing protein [Methylomirabilota bacterium]|nr:FxLYD domain-containing protein [Methylomirabilota bacterium]